jgi:hypothetical protein
MRLIALAGLMLLVASAPAQAQLAKDGPPTLDDLVRCLALDDTYWSMIVGAGAGERADADIDWRERTFTKALAEGARQNLSEDQIYERYNTVYEPLMETFLNDAQMAERNLCREAIK